MKVYTKREDLSRVTVENALEILVPVILLIDFRAAPCFFAMFAGMELSATHTALAWFFVAQMVVSAVSIGVVVVKAIRRARMPKRFGVIPAEMIRRALEVRR
jgi:hypothetical protein